MMHGFVTWQTENTKDFNSCTYKYRRLCGDSIRFVWKVRNASCTDYKTLTGYFQCMPFTVLWDRGIAHHSFLDKVGGHNTHSSAPPTADYALHLWWRKDKPRKGTCNSALIQISKCSEPTKLLWCEKLSKMLACTGCTALQIYTRSIEW